MWDSMVKSLRALLYLCDVAKLLSGIYYMWDSMVKSPRAILVWCY